jgi:hypothetical protein
MPVPVAPTAFHPLRRQAIWRLALSLVVPVLLIGPAAPIGGGPWLGSPTAAAATSTSTGLSTTLVGPRRALPRHFLGVNAESFVLPTDARLMTSSALQSKLAAMPGAVLRIQGGTTSQWIDWQNGQLIDQPGSPFASVSPSRPALTLRDWARLVKGSKATPLWDLNVLTSSLARQLSMLRRARSLGLSVRYVELGNELWDPEGPYVARFPTGASYGAAMNPWIVAIRKAFPGVAIAVSGADESDPQLNGGGIRYTSWNESLLTTVRGENAIAIHPYWSLPDQEAPGSDVVGTLTAGQVHWDGFSKSLDSIPEGVQVWLTEWNQAGRFAPMGSQIWAQALAVDAFVLDSLGDPQITMSLLHDLIDGAKQPQDVSASNVFPLFTDGSDGSTPLSRTALGYAFPFLVRAITGEQGAQTLKVRDGPEVGGQSGVIAVALTGARPSAILVNLTANPVVVSLPRSLDKPTRLTWLSAAPTSQPGWVSTDHVASGVARVYKTVRLPAYSVDQLSAASS